MKTVTVEVEYKIDDTVHTKTFTGFRIGTQLWDSGRACIIIYDELGRVVHTWHCPRVQTIDKVIYYP